ncbi:hypothetical protein, partial [Bacillus subtilis]|uniref:hypothetical protein n=1 Tax=Bacillus subtilis TaxID=1423 RepID=UPI001BDB9DEA
MRDGFLYLRMGVWEWVWGDECDGGFNILGGKRKNGNICFLKGCLGKNKFLDIGSLESISIMMKYLGKG